ncbi:hypothetical protein [Botrimarina sp.]|uniref:hypothetical protein n=1 Tax=Botrimarina sp. TaxID=2795802 RepID=UPI0032EB135A
MRSTVLLAAALLAASPAAQADIIQDLAAATIIEDFQFEDPSGTVLTAAANSAGTGHLWDEDTDTIDVVTNGSGQLNASLKANNDFGTNYVDNDVLTAASAYRVLGVMELTWDFQSTLDPSENEEIRISLIESDPRSTFIVAEWEIQREDDDTLTILGNGVGDGSSDIDPVLLNGGSLSQSVPFIAVVDANMTTDEYFLHFSADGGASFTTLGPASLDPARNTIESLRMTLNNDFSGDNVLIERVYLATIPEPGALALGVTALALGGLGRRRA